MVQVLWPVGLGVLGLVFGSFANVVIWRFPRGESLSSPASHCPACEHPVRPFDNVPVLSWLLLRGRCRDCGVSISPRYPAVELASGALWVLAGVRFGISWMTAVAIVFFYLLLVLSFIDLDTMRLPNPIVAMLAGLGLVAVLVGQLTSVAVAPLLAVGGVLSQPLAAAIVGGLLAGGVSLGIAAIYSGVRGRSGFGMGDVKLLAAMGPFLGIYAVGVLFVGSVFATVWAVGSAMRGGGSMSMKFPFGPFLALGAVAMTLFGPQVVHWYLSLFGV